VRPEGTGTDWRSKVTQNTLTGEAGDAGYSYNLHAIILVPRTWTIKHWIFVRGHTRLTYRYLFPRWAYKTKKNKNINSERWSL
jgi:hypothetical protein